MTSLSFDSEKKLNNLFQRKNQVDCTLHIYFQIKSQMCTQDLMTIHQKTLQFT